MNDLVTIHRKEAITTSLVVAETFGKKHKNVIQAVQELLPKLPESNRLIFKPVTYIDDKGRKQPMYEMNRDGFTLLAMGFTGKKALEFKLKYIDTFNQMEKAILHKNNLEWKQARLEGKAVRRILTDTIQEFVDYAIKQDSKHTETYFCNITKMIYKALNIHKAASGVTTRDFLEAMDLLFVSGAEYVCKAQLLAGMKQGLHYKEIFQVVKEHVNAYAETVNPCRQLSA